MLVRSFQVDDTDAVINLWERCDLVVPWNDPHKDIERKLKVGRELFLVGELDRAIVATAMGGYEGHRGWVNYLAVCPDHRQKGFGQDMMASLEQMLLDLGCPKINLQVRSTNSHVIAFYNSIGYQDDNVVSLGKRLVPDDR